MKQIQAGHRLPLDRLKPELAQLHYAGFDLFPGVESEDRARALELAVPLLGGDERAVLRARCLDLAYAMSHAFLWEDKAVLMEKVDVSHFYAVIPRMIVNVERALRESRGGQNPYFSKREIEENHDPALRRLLGSLQKARGDFSRNLTLSYGTLMGLAGDYAKHVGAFNDQGHLAAKPWVEALDEDDSWILSWSPQQFFPHVLFEPSFEKIEIENYAEKILHRWPTGEHPMGLLEAFEAIFYDGNQDAVRGKRFSAHDIRHSKQWHDRLDSGLDSTSRIIIHSTRFISASTAGMTTRSCFRIRWTLGVLRSCWRRFD